MSGKPLDSKREEFRKYLEEAGIIDAFTKVLVSLYEEPDKPTDPLVYLRQQLDAVSPPDGGDPTSDGPQLQALREENERLKETTARLQAQLEQLQGKPSPGSESVTAAAAAQPAESQ